MNRERRFLPSFLCGGAAGCIEICITYPTEFWKVNTQLGIRGYPHTAGGAAAGILHKCKSQGYFRTLYTGSPAFFLFAFPRSAIRFSSFETSRKLLSNNLSNFNKDLVCGAFAGLLESIFCLTPQNNISVKLTKQGMGLGSPRLGFLQGLSKAYKQVGLRGFILPGLGGTMIKNTTNYAVRFSLFYSVKRWLEKDLDNRNPLPTYLLVLTGLATGGVSACITQPVDVIRTRQMALWTPTDRPNMLVTARTLINGEGGSLTSLYKGLGPRFVRVSLEIAILFAGYEKIQQFVEEYVAK
jgi:solute carrier family 25 (mitochondrial citrate transporter), member 1